MTRTRTSRTFPSHEDLFRFEKQLLSSHKGFLAGVDEAGRGPLAGPVVAAAVILPIRWVQTGFPSAHDFLTDSKKLTAAQRILLFEWLQREEEIQWSVAAVDAEEIDRMNILQATWLAMKHAVESLPVPPVHCLVDGLPVQGMPCPHTALVNGDARSYSIAAASVIAKVTRDRFMEACDKEFPNYGFREHKGYGTQRHLDAISRFGPCALHRRSFSPLRPKHSQQNLFPE